MGSNSNPEYSVSTIPFPVEKIKPTELKAIHTGNIANLLDLKDVCKHYFEVIIEESKYECATVERLANAASNGLSIIKCFEEFGIWIL